MLRSSLYAASAFALMAGASAQSNPLADSAVQITGPVKYAGTYNVQTQTWTRGQSVVSNFGQSDNIYSNTAASGYYYPTIGPLGGAAGGELIDDAAIPSSSNPGSFAGGPLRDMSTVNEVQIGYCDFDVGFQVAGWELNFYNTYDPCSGVPDPTQLAGTAAVTGAPSNGCWIVDITGLNFDLQHDGDGFFDGIQTLDNFGIEFSYTGTGVDNAGPIITGDPQNTDTGFVVGGLPVSGSNTYYGEVGGCPGFGSGYENNDFYYVEDSQGVGGLSAGSGCYFFGGYNNAGSPCGGPLAAPFGAFQVEVSGTGSNPGPTIISQPGCVGNNNDTGVPGEVEVEGSAVGANNDALLRAFNLPLNQFGIFASGRADLPPGQINSGNGTLCINPGAAGGLGRFAAANQIKNTGATGVMTLDTNTGEWDLSMIPTSVGTYAAAAGVTSYFQGWHRETQGAGFNFTGSCSVMWQ